MLEESRKEKEMYPPNPEYLREVAKPSEEDIAKFAQVLKAHPEIQGFEDRVYNELSKIYKSAEWCWQMIHEFPEGILRLTWAEGLTPILHIQDNHIYFVINKTMIAISKDGDKSENYVVMYDVDNHLRKCREGKYDFSTNHLQKLADLKSL